jgi:hypothetical protein
MASFQLEGAFLAHLKDNEIQFSVRYDCLSLTQGGFNVIKVDLDLNQKLLEKRSF